MVAPIPNHPVPLQVLTELFDPRHEGIVGPRFERVSSQIVRAQQALIGRKASFATIPMWLRDRDVLAEARKYGIRVVLSHQHLEQLSSAMREAALATTNNVIVFRSGPREAAAALTRLGSWSSGPLTRMPRLTAAATLLAGLQHNHPDEAPAEASNE